MLLFHKMLLHATTNFGQNFSHIFWNSFKQVIFPILPLQFEHTRLSLKAYGGMLSIPTGP